MQMEKQESKPDLESAQAAERGGGESSVGEVAGFPVGKGAAGPEKSPGPGNRQPSSRSCRDP